MPTAAAPTAHAYNVTSDARWNAWRLRQIAKLLKMHSCATNADIVRQLGVEATALKAANATLKAGGTVISRQEVAA